MEVISGVFQVFKPSYRSNQCNAAPLAVMRSVNHPLLDLTHMPIVSAIFSVAFFRRWEMLGCDAGALVGHTP